MLFDINNLNSYKKIIHKRAKMWKSGINSPKHEFNSMNVNMNIQFVFQKRYFHNRNKQDNAV